jgi:hypothetical protein
MIKYLIKLMIFTICLSSVIAVMPYIFKHEIANKTYSSRDKNLVMGFSNKDCSTVEEAGVYFFKKEDLHGKITNISCSTESNPNRVEYKFSSVGGSHCFGKVTMIKSPQKTVAVWKNEGLVSDYHCFSIGKYLEIEMES